MRKATGPTDISALPMLESLEIDIDPSLIEEALASLDRASVARVAAEAVTADDPEAASSADVSIDIELPTVTSEAPAAAAPSAVPASDDERRRLTLRVSAQQESMRRLEESLARVTEIRDGLDTQVRELRKAARQLEAEAASAFQRARRDREEAERLAEERTIRGILDIVDNVERALAHADSSEPTRILSGLQMIAEQFRGALRKMNVDRVGSALGTPFDPAVHEAVLHLPTSDVAAGGIVSEVAAGFILRGRLVRPARVVVASAHPAPVPSEAEPQPTADGE